MARKRMIDPSFWTDEKLGEHCNMVERLLFMGLISNADDEGRGRANPKLLMSSIFPYDDMRISDFKNSLAKLAGLGLIRLYQVESQQYFEIVNFKKYQTVNRPTPSEIPAYCDGAEIDSRNNHGGLTEDSLNAHGGLTPNRKEEKRKEVKGKEEKETRAREKHKYGQYGNVLLSDADMQALQTEFPDDYQERIEQLSAYVASSGKVYKNHLATLRNWARRDAEKKASAYGGKQTKFQNYPQEYGMSDFERAAMQKRLEDLT